MSIPQGGKGGKVPSPHPKKSLGQHFLKNPRVLEEIAERISPTSGDFLIEIGPGNGELTSKTLALAGKEGYSKYIAIEKDARFTEALQIRFPKDTEPKFEIIEGDALTEIPKIAPTTGNYKIFGNIPYYITGKLMRILWDLPHKPTCAVFLVQKEVAERMCAKAGDMNRLAAFIGFWGEPKIVKNVGKSDFSPPPKVDSAVIVLTVRENLKKNEVLRESYERLVKVFFAQPRKTALNNAQVLFSDDKVRTKTFLDAAGIDPTSRPHDISVEMLISMAEMLYNSPHGVLEK